jgi:hypothetical protein
MQTLHNKHNSIATVSLTSPAWSSASLLETWSPFAFLSLSDIRCPVNSFDFLCAWLSFFFSSFHVLYWVMRFSVPHTLWATCLHHFGFHSIPVEFYCVKVAVIWGNFMVSELFFSFFHVLNRSIGWLEDGEFGQVEPVNSLPFRIRNVCYFSEAIPECLIFSMPKPTIYHSG